MFHLATPISSACPISDFDDISTILTHSSLTGSRKAAPWQQYVGEDGHVFYVELAQTTTYPAAVHKKTDASSICSFCSTRSCHSCASEDTGYSSDADTHSSLSGQKSSRKSDNFGSSCSHRRSPSQTRLTDFEEDDDGVSVDGLDFEKYDGEGMQCRTNASVSPISSDHVADSDRTRIDGNETGSCRPRPMCKTKSGLCERHQGKLCACDKHSGKSNSCEQRMKCRDSSPLSSQSHKKTQNVRKEVVINLRPTGHAWDGRSKISWFEAVLGIVPGHKLDQSVSSRTKTSSDSDRLIIKGLSPDGPAVRNKELLIGDHIYSINGRQLMWSNLDSVVSYLNGTAKVRLVVGRSGDQIKQSIVTPDRLLLDTAGVAWVLSESASSPRVGERAGHLDGVCVLYMSMDGMESESMAQNDDVVYQFPKDDSVLTSLRGSFYTLAHLLTDSQDADMRTLTVVLDGDLVNVVCRREGKDLLFVAAPAKRLQASQLVTVTNGILRLVSLLFGSVSEAFHSNQHQACLDEFHGFLFAFLQPTFQGDNCASLTSLQGYMDYLPLPDDVLVSVSNTLTELEAAEFADMSDSFYGCRRMFTILGSAVYYKGRVVCSHLAAEDTQDVSLYLKHSGLLRLTKRHSLHQLLVWREIYPTRLCHEVSGINSIFGYSEPHARWFLMVVGVKNTLLACILEAGGCATQFEGACLPDPFYVDQARAALVQLQTPDILSAFQIRLCGDGLPATTTADKLLSQAYLDGSSRGSRNLDILLKSTTSLGLGLTHSHSFAALSNNSPLLRGQGFVGRRGQWQKSSIESDGSGESGGSGDGFFKAAHRRGRLFPPVNSSLPPQPALVVDSDVNTCKLSAGKENALLVCCQVNRQEGVLITSPAGSSSDSLHQQVVQNFYRCCASLQAEFSKGENKNRSAEGLLEDMNADTTFFSCREQGVMFSCSTADKSESKKSNPTLHYWVVGRKFRHPAPREVYVCFHESTPQNLVELAFRLSLGSLSLT